MQKPAKWNYTAEDFLESTTPYEELEKCNGDPFLQQRMIEAMSKYATSIGFRISATNRVSEHHGALTLQSIPRILRTSRSSLTLENGKRTTVGYGNRRGKERPLPVRIRSFLSNGW